MLNLHLSFFALCAVSPRLGRHINNLPITLGGNNIFFKFKALCAVLGFVFQQNKCEANWPRGKGTWLGGVVPPPPVITKSHISPCKSGTYAHRDLGLCHVLEYILGNKGYFFHKDCFYHFGIIAFSGKKKYFFPIFFLFMVN